jgi:hypothetical protein
MFLPLPEIPVWGQQLAGILPLSALIEFIDTPRLLHIFELTGAIPIWCFPVTPSGSRILLSDRNIEDCCYLDASNSGPAPVCLDGRYGDSYPMMSPETTRLFLKSLPSVAIPNDHENMKRSDNRLQRLELIRVYRSAKASTIKQESIYAATSILGWVLLVTMLALCIVTGLYLSLSFLIVVTLTGITIHIAHSCEPRRLGKAGGSNFNRLVIIAGHTNETQWRVFFGESTIINSLLNWPLRAKRRYNFLPSAVTKPLLRLLFLSQWCLAVGAATTQGWDAYVITFWVLTCIVASSVVFASDNRVGYWAENYALRDSSAKRAGFGMERFVTELSSRRALLNTIMALNPDSVKEDTKPARGGQHQFSLNEEALRWMDPILKMSADRAKWEEASLAAMLEGSSAINGAKRSDDGPKHQENWRKIYHTEYWTPFIPEGLQMAEKIRSKARL